MERLVSSVSRPSLRSIRYIPRLIQTAHASQSTRPSSFLSATSLNYIDAMFEQWSKDPKSVHKV